MPKSRLKHSVQLFVVGVGLGIPIFLFALSAAIWLEPTPAISTASSATPRPATATVSTTPLPTTRPPFTATPAPPTPTGTPVVTAGINFAATARAMTQATRQAQNKAAVAGQLQLLTQGKPVLAKNQAAAAYGWDTRLVLAHYFAWFDAQGWGDCNISAGDRPLQPYGSDDAEAIARHIQMAREIGLNGFTLHWFAPYDRTDKNFSTMLNQAAGTNFSATVVFSRHIWHGSPRPNSDNIAAALRYIIEQHSPQPNFLRVANKPVIFFTDVYRTPASGQSPPQFWAAIRDQVDPQRQTIWIAEGLDPAYLATFDGLYVFKISHAAYPRDFEKSARWGGWVREWAKQTGQPKLWIATISPGWDDLRSGCKPDVRIDNQAHRLDRANGAMYEATFQAAITSNPDWLIVGSFNEWVEGTYIEPSEQYGDKYMQLTGDFVRRFQADE